MEIILAIPAFVIGIVLLWKGSDILVDGTSKTAAQLGVSSLIISVILVGFGTSAPEFAISVGAAVQGNSDISLGNVIGSCIANILLVLGIGGIIRPITIRTAVLRREAPIVLLAAVLLLVFSFVGLLDEYNIYGGILFLLAFIGFVIFFIRIAHKERDKGKKYKTGKISKNLIFVTLGIIAVVGGAYVLIESSISIAIFFGIPTFFIAISVVAVGTSLPELCVSAVAAYKDQDDIAIGNVLGSNVFNILLILGIAALFIPLNTYESFHHIVLLFFVTLLIFPIIATGSKITRLEGFIMLIGYVFYMWYTFFGFEIILPFFTG